MRASRTAFRTLLVAALGSAPSSTAAQASIPDEFTNLRFLPEDIQKRDLINIMRGFTIQLGVGTMQLLPHRIR